MNIDDIEKIRDMIVLLESHGYTGAAQKLKAVVEREFAKIAESLGEK